MILGVIASLAMLKLDRTDTAFRTGWSMLLIPDERGNASNFVLGVGLRPEGGPGGVSVRHAITGTVGITLSAPEKLL